MKNRLTSNDITISTLLPSLTVRHSYYKAIPHHFRDTETVEIRLHHLRLLELQLSLNSKLDRINHLSFYIVPLLAKLDLLLDNKDSYLNLTLLSPQSQCASHCGVPCSKLCYLTPKAQSEVRDIEGQLSEVIALKAQLMRDVETLKKDCELNMVLPQMPVQIQPLPQLQAQRQPLDEGSLKGLKHAVNEGYLSQVIVQSAQLYQELIEGGDDLMANHNQHYISSILDYPQSQPLVVNQRNQDLEVMICQARASVIQAKELFIDVRDTREVDQSFMRMIQLILCDIEEVAYCFRTRCHYMQEYSSKCAAVFEDIREDLNLLYELLRVVSQVIKVMQKTAALQQPFDKLTNAAVAQFKERFPLMVFRQRSISVDDIRPQTTHRISSNQREDRLPTYKDLITYAINEFIHLKNTSNGQQAIKGITKDFAGFKRGRQLVDQERQLYLRQPSPSQEQLQ